jgi:hypothetical protein
MLLVILSHRAFLLCLLREPHWRLAMQEEFHALLRNNTWTLVPPRPGFNIVGCKWVYKTKRKADGSIE